jgi:single-strand DNA-binding protein
MADNSIVIAGALGAAPELKYTPTGRAVANFNVAVSRRWQKDGTWQEETDWVRCTLWGSLAENAAASLDKGSRVVVMGRLSVRQYETTEGDKRTITELVADDIGASLKWATMEVSRNEREKPEVQAAEAEEAF